MVGAAAGVATEWADYNTFIGAQAGWDNNRTNSTTNANHNTYVGFSTGFTNREGQFNVGMGSLADYDNTNRSSTMFFGYNITASNNNVMGFGNNSFIDGQYSISLGIDHDIRGQNSIMMGHLGNMQALADYSVGIGDRVDIEENDVVGIGRSVDVDNQFAIAIGSTTVASNDGAIVMGYQATSTDAAALDPTNNIAIGVQATTSSNSSISLGTLTSTTADNAIAIGNSATAGNLNAIAIGNGATTTADNTMILGGETNPLSVGIGTNTPNATASLDLSDTNKGFLMNRLTSSQRSALSLTSAEAGMMVFDTNENRFYFWDGSAWVGLANSAAAGSGSVPDLLNYQSSIRDGSGEILPNQLVSFRMSILDNTLSAIYTETHSATTTAQSIVSLTIGSGTPTLGDFATIDWGSGNHSLQVELDPTGGTTYVNMGTSQFVSVPYALRAKYAENVNSSLWDGGSSDQKITQQALIKQLKTENEALKKDLQDLNNKVDAILKKMK